jgi:hypothetical protein
MAFHAGRREARSQQPRGEGSEFHGKPEKQSDARGRLADRLRHGNGRERRWSASTRRYPPRSAPGHVFQPGALIVPEITSIVRRPLTGRRRGSR